MSAKPFFFRLVFPEIDPNFPITPKAEIHAWHGSTYEPLTPELTESEFDGYIDHLIQELQQIRKEGNRKFDAARTKLKKQRL